MHAENQFQLIPTGYQRPQLKSIYEESNKKLTKWLTISNRVVYCFILPSFVVMGAIPSLYIYYFVDHSENAFLQLFPTQLSSDPFY